MVTCLFTSKNASVLSTFVVQYFGKQNLMCLVATHYQFSCRTDEKFSFQLFDD